MVSMSKQPAAEALPVEMSSHEPGFSNSPRAENAPEDVYPEVQPLAELAPGFSNTKAVQSAAAESKVVDHAEDKTVAKKAPAKPAAAKPAKKG